jgi:transposase InsO family protein
MSENEKERQAWRQEHIANARYEQERLRQWRARRQYDEWMSKGRQYVSPLGGQAKRSG